MSLSKVFEAGQAYVALSRAQSLDSIRILDFDMKQVWADPDVLRFYKMFRRQLHDQTFIPLGQRSKSATNGEKKSNGLSKLKKSLMDKPLVNICWDIYIDATDYHQLISFSLVSSIKQFPLNFVFISCQLISKFISKF